MFHWMTSPWPPYRTRGASGHVTGTRMMLAHVPEKSHPGVPASAVMFGGEPPAPAPPIPTMTGGVPPVPGGGGSSGGGGSAGGIVVLGGDEVPPVDCDGGPGWTMSTPPVPRSVAGAPPDPREATTGFSEGSESLNSCERSDAP